MHFVNRKTHFFEHSALSFLHLFESFNIFTFLFLSLQPDPPELPFATVNLYARKQGYEQVESENLQVFADTTTIQNLEMIPLAELPFGWDQTVIFDTPPQNL